MRGHHAKMSLLVSYNSLLVRIYSVKQLQTSGSLAFLDDGEHGVER
jgi:hypothetical protein